MRGAGGSCLTIGKSRLRPYLGGKNRPRTSGMRTSPLGWAGPWILRLYGIPCPHRAHRQRIPRTADLGRAGRNVDVMDAPARRGGVRVDGRPDGSQSAADDLYPVVLDLQFHRGLLTEPFYFCCFSARSWESAWAPSGQPAPLWQWKPGQPGPAD